VIPGWTNGWKYANNSHEGTFAPLILVLSPQIRTLLENGNSVRIVRDSPEARIGEFSGTLPFSESAVPTPPRERIHNP